MEKKFETRQDALAAAASLNPSSWKNAKVQKKGTYYILTVQVAHNRPRSVRYVMQDDGEML